MSSAPITITWLGHATVLVEVGGVRLITDPTLRPRVAHLRRRTPVPTVEPVDAVLITHLHMDHLHVPSLRLVAPGARVVVPAGGRSLLRGIHANEIDEVRDGERLMIGDMTDGVRDAVVVDVVHAEHLAGRGPHSRARAEPIGYVIRSGGRSVYVAGDTDLFDGMRSLGPLDVALLPIWGWGPTLGERHLDPVSAATATAWIDPVVVVPMHWGTYSPVRVRRGSPPWLDDPLAAFTDELTKVGLADRLQPLRPGGHLVLR